MKTYTARSEMCINVRVGERCRHVAFIPRTMGGSSFATDDPSLQSAIEHHRYFGNRILLARSQSAAPPPPAAAPSVTTVDVHSLAEAKDYVVERLGISRTKLRTSEQIFAVAKEKGIILRLL